MSQAYDIKQPVFLFEMDLAQLLTHVPDAITSAPLPKYPSVSRDATLIVDKNVEAAAIVDHVWQAQEPLVETVKLFDPF